MNIYVIISLTTMRDIVEHNITEDDNCSCHCHDGECHCQDCTSCEQTEIKECCKTNPIIVLEPSPDDFDDWD